jgi:3-oxoacyl-[acyl-carrier protein] reductase
MDRGMNRPTGVSAEAVPDFADRHGAALVLGASGGIGLAISAMLWSRGCSLAMTYRSTVLDPARLAALSGGQPTGSPDRDRPPVRAYQLDLTDAAKCADVVAAVARDFGGIHTLIYAAGPRVPLTHLSQVTPARLKSQLLDDSVAFFNAVSPALPHLRAVQGAIVAVTTVATARYPVRDGLSSVPKAAVEALVRGLAVEEGRFGVRANCVAPGMLSDGMSARLMKTGELDERTLGVALSHTPLRRFGTAADVAEAACFLASERARSITGQKLNIDGGYSA